MKKNYAAVGIIFLFVGAGILPALAQNTEKPLPASREGWLYVGGSGPGNYTRIQDAINASSDGDTVFIYDDSSPYFENLKITQNSLSVLGEDEQTTILICSRHSIDRAILITGESVRISGFTLMQQGYQTLYFVITSKQVQVTHNIIIGLQLWLPNHADWCHISKNHIQGLYGTTGIVMYGKYNVVSENNITGCGMGVFVGYETGSYSVRPVANVVMRNNFLNNSSNAKFATAWLTLWRNNYWDDYQGTGAYEIQGKMIFLRGEDKPPRIFDWKNFDRHPALEPYPI